MEQNVMTPEEFAEKMLVFSTWSDVEVLHICMDGLMCDVLRSLGYGAGVDIYKATPKYHA